MNTALLGHSFGRTPFGLHAVAAAAQQCCGDPGDCSAPCEEEALAFVGTCQSCGAYWDVRFYPVCPSPCGGEVL